MPSPSLRGTLRLLPSIPGQASPLLSAEPDWPPLKRTWLGTKREKWENHDRKQFSKPLTASESESRSVVSDSLHPHGLYSPWNSPGQNTGVGSLSLLQGTVPTQGSNQGLPHYRQILYQLSHQETASKRTQGTDTSTQPCPTQPPGLRFMVATPAFLAIMERTSIRLPQTWAPKIQLTQSPLALPLKSVLSQELGFTNTFSVADCAWDCYQSMISTSQPWGQKEWADGRTHAASKSDLEQKIAQWNPAWSHLPSLAWNHRSYRAPGAHQEARPSWRNQEKSQDGARLSGLSFHHN